jgi:hypothetical protein
VSRKFCAAIIVIVLSGTWIGCGSNGSSNNNTPTNTGTAPVVAISAQSGATQSAAAGQAFPSIFSAVVTQNGIPVSGQVVTFTAPASGASGSFANGTATDVEVTNLSGVATATAFTANTTGGSYSVMAQVSGASSPISFSLTNVPVTPFAFYVSGQESETYSYYALAGSVVMDASGNVWGGEQDYNDGGFGFASPQPGGDQITGGSLTFPAGAPPGQGTLTLNTNNLSLGLNSNGVEVFGVQFVNSSHALIVQYDGFDTSSGSMDLQTLPSTPNGGFAFAMSGFESSDDAVDFGGVFSVSGSSIANGMIDINDANNTGIRIGRAFTGTLAAADSYGRGTLSGVIVAGKNVNLRYYIIGPEAIRLVDVDTTDAAIGSAFGQGTATFSNASLGNSVFELSSTPYGDNYFAAIGQIVPSNTSAATADLSGFGEDDEPSNGIIASKTFSGTYTIASNGYGSLNINMTGGGNPEFGDFSTLGVYFTDPALNLSDPNNPVGGGGALAIDLSADALVIGGTGLFIPQSDVAVGDFQNSYVAGWQNFDFNGCGQEFDMVSQGTMVPAGSLTLTGMVSDPFYCLGTPDQTSSSDTFNSTPNPDLNHPGRYTLEGKNKITSFIDGATGPNFDMVLYQASAGQLFWLDFDTTLTTVSIGPLEQQGSLAGLPAAASVKAQWRAALGKAHLR